MRYAFRRYRTAVSVARAILYIFSEPAWYFGRDADISCQFAEALIGKFPIYNFSLDS